VDEARKSLLPFLPAVLAAATTGVTAANSPCEATELTRQRYRVSDRDVRGGSAGGSPKEMGTARRSCATAGRGVHRRIFSGVSLSPDDLCCRADNGEE
jgi:hypothetical protein